MEYLEKSNKLIFIRDGDGSLVWIFRKTPKIKDNGDAIVFVFLVADSLLGKYALINRVVIERSKPEFEPIVKDPKKGARQYFCVECGNVAAQTRTFQD